MSIHQTNCKKLSRSEQALLSLLRSEHVISRSLPQLCHSGFKGLGLSRESECVAVGGNDTDKAFIERQR